MFLYIVHVLSDRARWATYNDKTIAFNMVNYYDEMFTR